MTVVLWEVYADSSGDPAEVDARWPASQTQWTPQAQWRDRAQSPAQWPDQAAWPDPVPHADCDWPAPVDWPQELDPPPPAAAELPSPVDPHFIPGVREHAALARQHRPAGPEELCAVCDWHWPCPDYFRARRILITAGVHPAEWA